MLGLLIGVICRSLDRRGADEISWCTFCLQVNRLGDILWRGCRVRCALFAYLGILLI